MKQLFILLAAAAGLLAADATGTWTGTFTPTGEDARPAHLVLKQQGAVLTGTAGPNSADQRAIQKGKIEDGVLTFEVADSGMVMKFVLRQEGDELKGDVSRDRDGEHQTAKVAVRRSPQH